MNLLQMAPVPGFESNDQWMSNALKKFTNNRQLIEHNKENSDSNNINQFIEKNELCAISVPGTVANTQPSKSPSPVTLHVNDRVNLQTIITSTNIKMTGKFLLCRIVCEPRKFETILSLIDDPEGDCAVCLQIMFNFAGYKSKFSEDCLAVGTILVIKNPWLRTAENGTLYIKCDNPAEVVVLNQSTLDEIFPNLKWNGQIPKDLSFRQNENITLSDATNWKRIGNENFAFKKYKFAITAYTKAIQQGNDLVELFCNRSAAYLGISNYEEALTDAESALAIDKNHTKAICRKVKALFGMALYADAVTFLEEHICLDAIPKKDRKLITNLMIQGRSYRIQSQYGNYPWKELYQNQNTYLDLAEYTNEVVIKKSPINGRGLFATKTIRAGELILGSKAFAVDKEPPNTDTEYDNGKNHTQLVLDIAQILADNPEKCKDLFSLYPGPEMDYLCGCECEDAALMLKDFPLDMERIDAICQYNAFACESFSTQTLITNGLWIIPSFINHSCVNPNSTWRRIGDFLFVSAFRDISEGEEIVISYTAPYVLSFSQSTMDLYGFVCNCRLCERDRSDNATVRDYRADLLSQLMQMLRTYEANGNLLQKRDETDILRFFKLLKRSDCDHSPELNLIVVQPMLSFGSLLIHSKMFQKGAELFIDLYKIIQNVACFAVYSITVCVNIIVAYLSIGEIIKAEYWVKILKERIKLTYGSVEIVDSMPSVTVAMMREYGLDI